MSNLYLPFSLKNSNNFALYVQNMSAIPQNNLFNAAYTLPMIDN
jgi:hypothetical protein